MVLRFLVVLGALTFIWGCDSNEPTVPMSDKVNDDFIRVPINTDGSLDTVGQPIIKFEELSYDFGTIKRDVTVSHRFVFRNSGKKPLKIHDVSSQCGCTIPVYPQGAIAPGDTSSLLVKFNSKDKMNRQEKSITVHTNSFPNQSVINITCVVDTLL